MEATILVVVSLSLLVVVGLALWLPSRANKGSERLGQEMKDKLNALAVSVTEQTSRLRQEVDEKLTKVSTSLVESLAQTGSTLRVIGEKTGELLKATEGVQKLGSEISAFQSDLHKIFLQTHQVGAFGETVMERLLEDTLPQGSFSTQYSLRSGVVDAVIRVGDKLVPVDSKFPLESYKSLISADVAEQSKAHRQFIKDIQVHIDKIKGYIRPEESTFDFAMMFIPSEALFLEIVKEQQLLDYARQARVIPCCSHTFFAYLQAVALGLKGYKLQEGAEQVLTQLRQLEKDFFKFNRDFDVLGTHIGNAWNKYFQELKPGLQGLGNRVSSLTRLPADGVEQALPGFTEPKTDAHVAQPESDALPPERRGQPKRT